MGNEKKQCKYIFKKGKQMNERCTRTLRGNHSCCWEHRTKDNSSPVNNETPATDSSEDKTINSDPEVLILPKPVIPNNKQGVNNDEPVIEDELPNEHETCDNPVSSDDYDLNMDDDLFEPVNMETSDFVPDPQEEEKEKLITTYYQQFPWLKKELPIKQRKDKSADEWLSEINTLLDNKGIDKLVVVGFNGVCNVIETVGVRKGLKLQGYSQVMNSNENIHELLKIIRLRSMNNVTNYITPEWQLAATMMTTALSLQTLNTTNDKK